MTSVSHPPGPALRAPLREAPERQRPQKDSASRWLSSAAFGGCGLRGRAEVLARVHVVARKDVAGQVSAREWSAPVEGQRFALAVCCRLRRVRGLRGRAEVLARVHLVPRKDGPGGSAPGKGRRFALAVCCWLRGMRAAGAAAGGALCMAGEGPGPDLVDCCRQPVTRRTGATTVGEILFGVKYVQVWLRRVIVRGSTSGFVGWSTSPPPWVPNWKRRLWLVVR
jgi:hypothetical protein